MFAQFGVRLRRINQIIIKELITVCDLPKCRRYRRWFGKGSDVSVSYTTYLSRMLHHWTDTNSYFPTTILIISSAVTSAAVVYAVQVVRSLG